jgi:hypothetical protein
MLSVSELGYVDLNSMSDSAMMRSLTTAGESLYRSPSIVIDV